LPPRLSDPLAAFILPNSAQNVNGKSRSAISAKMVRTLFCPGLRYLHKPGQNIRLISS